MVGARSLAMALNRLIDAEIDARNPRTARREIPSGLLNRGQVLGVRGGLAGRLPDRGVAAAVAHPRLWPIPVIGFVIYPYLKRFTWTCHFFLGAVDGLAPLGGWIAVTNHLGLDPFLLGGAVALWIAGFDIIYAPWISRSIAPGTQLGPAAVRRGAGPADHAGGPSDLGGAAGVARSELGLGPLYYLGVAVIAGLLTYENAIVSEDDLSRVDMAFLTMNGVIAVVFLAGVLLDAVV